MCQKNNTIVRIRYTAKFITGVINSKVFSRILRFDWKQPVVSQNDYIMPHSLAFQNAFFFCYVLTQSIIAF